MPILEFRIADQNAVYRGVSLDDLMEGAGREVAAFVARRFKHGHPRVLILAGKGNNGGDGFAAADHLARAGHVTVVLAEGRDAFDPGGPAARAFKRIEAHRSIVKIAWSPKSRPAVLDAVRSAEVVIDCLLGSGIKGPPRPPFDELIAIVTRAKGLVVSVDVPSGFPFGPSVKPSVTLTIEAPKVGMTRKNSGTILPIHIGFPPAAWTHTGPGELLLIPEVSPHAHKGERGVLGVVAGGPYAGAPALVAMAAHACGVDLVHVFTPENVADIVRRFDPVLIVHPLEGNELGPSHVETITAQLAERGCSALAIGPGLGKSRATMDAARGLLGAVKIPSVIDADAIAAAATLPAGTVERSVLTPHAGEFKRFAGRTPGNADDVDARERACVVAARAKRTTILLKGRVDIITDGSRVKRNDTGVAAMAVGGTGDVLTGITGAMLSKGLTPFDAARVSAFVSGKAGELAFDEVGHSMKPTDVITQLPRVFARYLSWWGGKK